jgi:hypothetical protein
MMREQTMSFGNDPGVSGQANWKTELFLAKADAASAARLAGRKSFFLRLLDRLLRRRRERDGPDG